MDGVWGGEDLGPWGPAALEGAAPWEMWVARSSQAAWGGCALAPCGALSAFLPPLGEGQWPGSSAPVHSRVSPPASSGAVFHLTVALSSERWRLQIAGISCAIVTTQAAMKRGSKASGVRRHQSKKGSETQEQRKISEKPQEARGPIRRAS